MQSIYVLYASVAVFILSLVTFLFTRYLWNGLDSRIDDSGTIGFSEIDKQNVRGRFGLNQAVLDKSVVKHDAQKARLVKLEGQFEVDTVDSFVGVN